MDRDYLDDRRFPPDESGGVLVINAPNERELSALVDRIDRQLFQGDDVAALPLAGRKLQLNTDWGRDAVCRWASAIAPQATTTIATLAATPYSARRSVESLERTPFFALPSTYS